MKNNRAGNIQLPSLKKYFPWEAGRAAFVLVLAGVSKAHQHQGIACC